LRLERGGHGDVRRKRVNENAQLTRGLLSGSEDKGLDHAELKNPLTTFPSLRLGGKCTARALNRRVSGLPHSTCACPSCGFFHTRRSRLFDKGVHPGEKYAARVRQRTRMAWLCLKPINLTPNESIATPMPIMKRAKRSVRAWWSPGGIPIPFSSCAASEWSVQQRHESFAPQRHSLSPALSTA